MKSLVREMFCTRSTTRRPEPEMVMEEEESVNAYAHDGRMDGVWAPVYRFHTPHICQVLRPGDTVLDLGCGPATLLLLVARLNPQCHFIGVDLSAKMLAIAQAQADELQLTNIHFRLADIQDLSFAPDASVGAIVSTLSLHHLPSTQALHRCFAEIRRVLRPDGGLYLSDLGHLKSAKSIVNFVSLHEGEYSEIHSIDYQNSLWAAFEPDDFYAAYQRHLSSFGRFYQTFIVPYMVNVKSAVHPLSDAVLRELAAMDRAMTPAQRTDYKDLRLFFRMGGLVTV